ncbi:MAG: hypothetical protein LBE64_08720 [Acinetobacter pittii]|nr:hypothetical protein [Acinetobacter pittii]
MTSNNVSPHCQSLPKLNVSTHGVMGKKERKKERKKKTNAPGMLRLLSVIDVIGRILKTTSDVC